MVIHVLGWFLMIPMAIANGALRDLGYGRFVTELRAHQISTITAIIIFAVYARFLGTRFPLASTKEAALVGVTWCVATLAFEFLFGHYVAKRSWEYLLRDYALWEGRLWVLIPLTLLILPLLIFSSLISEKGT